MKLPWEMVCFANSIHAVFYIEKRIFKYSLFFLLLLGFMVYGLISMEIIL